MELFHRAQVITHTVCCVPCVISVLLLVLPVLVMSVGDDMAATMSPSGTIVQVDRCSWDTDQGIIDLWDVGNRAQPRFQYQQSSAPDDTGLYTFDPCYPFTQDACHEAMVCRFDENRQNAENIGAGQPGGILVFGTISPYPVLMFVGPLGRLGTSPTVTYVTLRCVDEMQEDTLEVTGNNAGTAEDIFNMVLESSSCCPRPQESGLSFGTILIILFLCVVVIYLVGGILYNKCARGASGLEVIPNLSFWLDFPYLVMDGVAFVVTCGKGVSSNPPEGGQSTPGTGPKSGYESI